MKSMKKTVALVLTVLMLMGFCSCGVNENTTVAKIEGTSYTKGEFDEYVQFYRFVQEAYGQAIVDEEIDVEYFKETLFKDYVLNQVFKLECDAANVKPDEAGLETSYEALITQAKTEFDGAGEYDALLEKYGYTEESLKAVALKLLGLMQYNNLYIDNNLGGYVGDLVAAKVEGEELDMASFYYFVGMQYYVSALQGDSSANIYDTQTFYEKCHDYLVNGYKAVLYAEEKGFEFTEEAIAESTGTMDLLNTYYGLNDFIKSTFLLTQNQVDAAEDFVGRCLAAQDFILDEYATTIKYDDTTIKGYYDLYAMNYDKSTVSAYHILTEDEEFAKQLETEAGGTADGFMAVYEKYKDNEKVKEATDLGEFTKNKMVSAFSECAFGLTEGGVASCKTEFGTHLVYVYKANPVETVYEDIKEQVEEDYLAEQKKFFGQSYIDAAIKGYKEKGMEKTYKNLASDLLMEHLEGKYSIKMYEEKAVK